MKSEPPLDADSGIPLDGPGGGAEMDSDLEVQFRWSARSTDQLIEVYSILVNAPENVTENKKNLNKTGWAKARVMMFEVN